MTNTANPRTATCKRCHATLTSARSIKTGMGPTCARKARQEAAVLAAGYKPHQLASAEQLLEDGGIVALLPGAYIGVSTDGDNTYLCTTHFCTCAAFEAGRRCYHRAAATMLAA